MRFGGISVWLLIYAMMPMPLPGGIPSGELHVYSLSRQGWHVLEKKSFVDRRPGQKPYQNLRRDVQVVQYRLQRGEEVLFCRVEYDSQQDTIREYCASTSEKAAEQVKN